MVILCLSQEAIACSKSATKTLKITEDNPNENIFKKQPSVLFYEKCYLKYFANS